MTTKRLCYEIPGGVAVIIPMDHARLVRAYRGDEFKPPIPLSEVGRNMDPLDPDVEYAETEDEFLARVIARNIETARQKDRRGNVVNPHLTSPAQVIIVDEKDLPSRDQRDGWRIVAGRVVV